MSENILDAVRRHARERGGDLAYRTPARNWTFAQVDEASNRVAQGLKTGEMSAVAAFLESQP